MWCFLIERAYFDGGKSDLCGFSLAENSSKDIIYLINSTKAANDAFQESLQHYKTYKSNLDLAKKFRTNVSNLIQCKIELSQFDESLAEYKKMQIALNEIFQEYDQELLLHENKEMIKKKKVDTNNIVSEVGLSICLISVILNSNFNLNGRQIINRFRLKNYRTNFTVKSIGHEL